MRNAVYAINITLDGCCSHTDLIADDELHEYFTELLGKADIALFGRKTYQLMFPYWHTVAENQSETKVTNEFAGKGPHLFETGNFREPLLLKIVGSKKFRSGIVGDKSDK